MKPRALITAWDKTGIEALGHGLVDLGYELVSTGGTALAFRNASIPVIDVSEVTQFPEMLDGRVKVLHPAIQAPLLSKDTDAHNAVLTEYGWSRIEIVVCNLYPFSDVIAKPDCTYEKANENIDIGGPTAIRAACKGNRLVVVDPSHYEMLLQALADPLSARYQMARLALMLTKSMGLSAKIQGMEDPAEVMRCLRSLLKTVVFRYTSGYDTAVYEYEKDQLLALGGE